MRPLICVVALACGPAPSTPDPVTDPPPTSVPPLPTGSTASTADTGAPVAPSDCPDIASFAWSADEPLREADLLQAYGGAVGLDEMGRGWFLAHEDVGATGTISISRLDADGAWSPPAELHRNNLSREGWSPRVAVNGAGDGLATFREDANSGGALFAVTLAADGTVGAKVDLGPDDDAFSVLPTIDATGVRLGLYTLDDGGVAKVFTTDGTAPGKIGFADPMGARVLSWNREPDGPGMLFASLDDSAFSVVAVPWDPIDGFGAPEPVATNPTNGFGGAWLGDGRAIFVFEVLPGPGQRIQIFLTERLPEGTWTVPVRIDTGDGSAHASASPPLAGRAGEAFVRWEQPDGEKIARFVAGSGLSDVQTFPRNSLYDVAADRCGNALALQRGAGSNALWAVHHRSGDGWQAPVDVRPDGTPAAQWATATLASTGEGLVVFELSDRYRFARFR